ncbi:hypothetical protein OPW41_04515 [Vibrio europaeus]|uniref:Porin n=1 Tax=Vibrio europaeus TaxID=300876 RepID=A0A178J776_9VIBR|nr:hypothetical protein [Vibrio europaeus]MDC5705129.1 hypothetical protein [Vibrio europaeus]MDC5710408.1 hypothetical protein [Vibrio europaeus]MDC5715498.1 hypothetical protein [Vibrio europaeus]MDC5719659.1 hypothetical protein [Vibrio europaeus]MDC5724453.1 hypothetical protein [Vibrio europaeus]
MKKLVVASTLLATLTSFSSAATDIEVSHGNNKETTFKLYHSIFGGLNGGFESVGSDNLKHHKETTFSLDYKIEMGQAFIMPSFDLTLPSDYSKEHKYTDEYGSATYKDSNVAKFGLKAGYDFGNGLYTAARYRYEISDGKGEFTFDPDNGTLKTKSKLHRVDLTVGYNVMDTVDLSANYIVKRSTHRGELAVSNWGDSAKATANANEFELKSVLTSLGAFKPYAQYTYKSQTEVKGAGSHSGKYKNDNVFKIGVVYSY